MAKTSPSKCSLEIQARRTSKSACGVSLFAAFTRSCDGWAFVSAFRLMSQKRSSPSSRGRCSRTWREKPVERTEGIRSTFIAVGYEADVAALLVTVREPRCSTRRCDGRARVAVPVVLSVSGETFFSNASEWPGTCGGGPSFARPEVIARRAIPSGRRPTVGGRRALRGSGVVGASTTKWRRRETARAKGVRPRGK